MGGNFNIRDAEWDSSVLLHSAAGQFLRDLADSYSLVRSLPALSVTTHYLDISSHANSVINLIFLDINCAQVIHHIEPDLRWPSDYAPLIVDLSIASENIQMYRKVLKQDSKEQAAFLLSVSEGLSQLDFSALDFITGLDMLSEAISGLFADCWATYAKRITVTSRSKEWWNNECRAALETYRWTGEQSDWFLFCSTTRQAKKQFFDNRIAEIASTNKQPWDLISWVKQ